MSYVEQFELSPHLVHLNHAGIAPWPRNTVKAVTRFAYENACQGSSHYAKWLQEEQALRELGRWLLDAESAAEVALLKNTSEGLSLIASGLPWKKGGNIVLARQEFPSNRIVWEAIAKRHGLEVRMADLTDQHAPERALLNLVDNKTQLLTTSSVHYGTGLKMDLGVLGEALRDTPIWFCVDAIQSLGAHPFSVRDHHIDFACADGHKWMLGPEGIALFWVRPDLYETLHLSQFGWHMVEDPNHYDRLTWSVASDARRFECGSPNMLGIFALRASLELLHSAGICHIEECISKRIEQIEQSLKALKCSVLTSQDPMRRAGILTFTPPQGDSEAVAQALNQRGILCAARAGGIRFSPHFYTSAADLQRGLETLQQVLER